MTKHEGIDSFHGADPKGTVHVPEFLDHCIRALMQMGACSSFFTPSENRKAESLPSQTLSLIHI